MMVLDVHHISFDYPSMGLSEHRQSLLHDISLQLSAGQLLHIRGANGSGKTTLLKLLAGILRPDEGSICYGGQNIWTQSSVFQQHICYLGHKTGISQALTVAENSLYELQRPQDWGDLEVSLRALGLFECKEVPCGFLSAGQKRRVGLMRLFMSTATLWLLDEPLVALDEAGVTLLMGLLKTHVAGGGQVIYTSHQPLSWMDDAHQVYSL